MTNETPKAANLLQEAITAIQEGALTEDKVGDIVESHVRESFNLAFENDRFVEGLSEQVRHNVNSILHSEEGPLTTDKVRRLFAESLSKAIDAIPPREINIDLGKIKTSMTGKHVHPQFETVLRAVAAGCNVMLIGPAGSGKSTIAKQVAEALERPFYSQGPATSEYKYLGFVDGNGNMVETPLHTAFRDGGLFCAEEVDTSSASALVAGLNMVLANGTADFGNIMVKRHENFACIATANTWGSGADRLYVGRNQLDAATLDRFVTIHIDYDETLERAVAQHDAWTDFVQGARKAATTLKLRCVISPRASIQGAALIRADIPQKDVAAMTLWRGMDQNTIDKVKVQMKADRAAAKAA